MGKGDSSIPGANNAPGKGEGGKTERAKRITRLQNTASNKEKVKPNIKRPGDPRQGDKLQIPGVGRAVFRLDSVHQGSLGEKSLPLAKTFTLNNPQSVQSPPLSPTRKVLDPPLLWGQLSP